jgi:hypothetical protein
MHTHQFGIRTTKAISVQKYPKSHTTEYPANLVAQAANPSPNSTRLSGNAATAKADQTKNDLRVPVATHTARKT